jgi:hypothetical protein
MSHAAPNVRKVATDRQGNAGCPKRLRLTQSSIHLGFGPDEWAECLCRPGRGARHRFHLDTGSVGIVVPRHRLGPDYQKFDCSQDTEFRCASSGRVYWGQWVKAPVVLGVPMTWDGTGDYPVAEVEVFAVDQPAVGG